MISHDPVTTERLILKKIMQVKHLAQCLVQRILLSYVRLVQYYSSSIVAVKCSVMSNSLWPHGLSTQFSRQEYWSGLPSPSPGDLLTQGWNPGLPHCRPDSLPSVLLGKPSIIIKLNLTFPSPPRAGLTPTGTIDNSISLIYSELVKLRHLIANWP